MTCDHGQCVPKTDSFKANGSCNNDPFNETFASGKPFESRNQSMHQQCWFNIQVAKIGV